LDASTAAAIFERRHAAVFRYFKRMTGDIDLAQDLTQEVFVRVLRGLDAYSDLGREVSWLYQIARNVLIDHHREVQVLPPTIHLVDEVGADCTRIVAFGFQEALALLPEEEREVFILRETEGLTYLEIAAACEITEERVRARLRRARLLLRRLLSKRLSQAPELRRKDGAS